MTDNIVRTNYDMQQGPRYRQLPKGDSTPTDPKWQEYDNQQKAQKRKAKAGDTPSLPLPSEAKTPAQLLPSPQGESPAQLLPSPQGESPAQLPPSPQGEGLGVGSVTPSLTPKQQLLVRAIDELYQAGIDDGDHHKTFMGETAAWLLFANDNNQAEALKVALNLDYIKKWTTREPNELENVLRTVSQRPLITKLPKKLTDLLAKAEGKSTEGNDTDLPMSEWVERIRGFFGVYPCMREVCENAQQRLWPFLIFATSGLAGTLMTLCWWFSYDNPFKKRRLNYNILGVGDPAVGKGPLEDLVELWTEPISRADQLANDMMNNWKEVARSLATNKDKAAKPKGVVRMHGARTSNNVFIGDMMNAWTEVDGERMYLHMLTTDSEALNSIKMAKGGSWIDRSVMEIKAWSNEKDSQQYANLDSMTGSFNVFWNQVRTLTPPAMKVLANERNFGSGWPLRVSAIPVPDNDFDMIPLRTRDEKQTSIDTDVVREWANRLDKRRGELPLWPLVERAWHWTNDHMEVAKFNQDRADRMLLKRISQTTLCIAAPWVDMRHWEEREKTGTYTCDDTDIALLNLLLDIQYKTQRHFFYELARNYYDEQQKDATTFRRRTTRFEQCYQQLTQEFTTEQFVKTFGYANQHSAAKTLERLLEDKTIKRVKRGLYAKRVQSIA